MLEGEGPELFGVALGADGVAGGGGAQQLVLRGAVRIVAIGALQQTFVDAVMNRLRELRLDIGVTGVAEVGLSGLQQIDLLPGRMHGVAAEAADLAFGMNIAEVVVMVAIGLVAGEA